MKDMISLSNLFNNKIFRIPDYQRGYAWTENQLNDFWDDLINLNGDRYHYTGMLSLKELSFEACKDWKEDLWLLEDDYKGFHVVDGQQRLTTCVILLNSILCFAQAQGKTIIKNKSTDEIRKKYIVEVGPLGLNKAYKFGYATDNPSFEFLRYKILGEKYPKDISESFYTHNLQNAKEYFDNRIQQLFNDKGFEEIENLYLKLVNKLVFNIHYIDDDFDVFIAFETMNNRGKKLSNLEILKNRLIYLTTIYPDNVLNADLKEALRKRINETWMEIYKQLGRNKNILLSDDEFLKNHWTIFYKYTRNQGDDYIHFLLNMQFTPKAIYGERAELIYSSIDLDDAEFDSYDNDDEVLTPKEIIDYVDSLKDLAKYWYYSFNPEDNPCLTDEEAKWINKLNRIGMNYFRTLVVTSMWSDQITSEQRVTLFKTIEKFIFLCFRLAKYNATYNSVNSYKYARSLYKKEVSVEKIISFFENEFERNKEDALKAFQNDTERLFKSYDGFYSWHPRWYFLFEYEAYLSQGRNIAKLDDWDKFTKNDKDKISIEHIYPQKPTSWYWRNQFRNYTDIYEQHVLANSLGNLLALSQSVNSSLQNKDFELKKYPGDGRNGYITGSYSEQEVAKCADWSPQEILARGLKLLDFMEERWDIKFHDEETKISILGLSFLSDGREDAPELEKIDYRDRDSCYVGGVKEVKVSDFLKNKNMFLVKYYFEFYDLLKAVIPDIYETATKHYISLRSKGTPVILAEVHILNSKKRIELITKSPTQAENDVGIMLPDTYLWSKNYKITLADGDNCSKAINVIKEYYNRLISGEEYGQDDEQYLLQRQQDRTNSYIGCLNNYADDIVFLTKARRYTRFASNKIRETVGLCGDGSWSHIQDLVVYEISNRFHACTLSLLVGPGVPEAREKWINFCDKNTFFSLGKRGDKWTSVYNIKLFDENMSLDESMDILKKFMEGDFKEIDKLFENSQR